MDNIRQVAEKLGYRAGAVISGILDGRGRFVAVPEGYFRDQVVPTVQMKVMKIDWEKRESDSDFEV